MYNLFMPDVAQLLLRVVVGTFFVLARFRWVYDPGMSSFVRDPVTGEPQRVAATWRDYGSKWFNLYRRKHLQWKLCHCGYGTHPAMAAAVALTEIMGGLALIFGLLTSLAALGLVVVTLFATVCTAKEKTARQNPVDKIDWVSCYLWNPEPHLLMGALVVCLAGPGKYSLDAVVQYLLLTV